MAKSKPISEIKTGHTPPSDYSESDYEMLFDTVKKYEERIKEIEGSSYWKIYLFFTKAKLILTSDSYLKHDKWRFFQRIRFLFSKFGLFLIGKFFRQFFALVFGKVHRIVGRGKKIEHLYYEAFKAKFFPRSSDIEQMATNMKFFKLKPTVDLCVFVDSQNFKNLNQFLNTLEQQVYTDFSVQFIAVKPSELIAYTLGKIAAADDRFSFETHIEIPQNHLQSDKDFLFFTNLNSLLTPECLYTFVDHINKYPSVDFIYSDHDFVSKNEAAITENPYFKPSWSPHTLLSRNYIGETFMVSSVCYYKQPLQSYVNIYSMVLNLTDSARKVGHVPQVLYHYNAPTLTSEKIKKNHQVLNRFMAVKYPKSFAKLSSTALGCFCPVFKFTDKPLVSIIIPAKNKGAVLETCLNSIIESIKYPNYEIIIIDNGSTEKSFFSSVAQYEFNYPNKIKCYSLDIPFNYAVINNHAVQYAKGDYLLFLNNDTKVISPNLVDEMLKVAIQENVGVVGPKLLYPNNTIQHAGIVLSIDETGAHVYSGAHKDTSGYFNNVNCLTNYSAVTGACMMIQKNKFELAGGFDENLAVDCNDVELCCKLMALGYFNVYIPWVSMYHHECLTRGNPMLSAHSMIRQSNEKAYFLKKWSDKIVNDPFYNRNLSRTSKYFDLKDV
jgi:GT2 family glycosyltransferase